MLKAKASTPTDAPANCRPKTSSLLNPHVLQIALGEYEKQNANRAASIRTNRPIKSKPHSSHTHIH